MRAFILNPACKDYLWGGNKLKEKYSKEFDEDILAETWECSVHPDGQSVIRTGEFHGKTLSDVLTSHPEFLGTKHHSLPILIKFIDAKQDLSVQVHPDDNYAQMFENDNGKIEMWYVLEAAKDSKLVCGFSHDVTPKQLKDSCESSDLSKHLQYIPVHKGDVFLIKPGTVHAIGSGILLAEIQESSNVTYRVYDYNRVDKRTGQKRELHFEKALKVLNMNKSDSVRQPLRFIKYCPGSSNELVGRCKYFDTVKICVNQKTEFSVLQESFQVVLCIEGSAELSDGVDSISFKKGDCIFIPANSGRMTITGRTEVLKVRC